MSTNGSIKSNVLFKNSKPLSFGEVLRAWRLSEEQSLVSMAATLGISRANLCDIEKGRKIPTPARALRIAKKLGMQETHVVELVLQDMLRKDKIKMTISVAA